MEHLLWQALEQGIRRLYSIARFELLTPDQRSSDPAVVRRLHQLCKFLDRHRDDFRMRGLRGSRAPGVPTAQLPPLRSSLWRTGARIVEQVWRRRYA
jgi:hypothetical protein